MSRTRILGYLSNDDSLGAVALAQAGQDLDVEDAWDGVGISWLQDGRTLERKNPRSNAASDLVGLMADLPSRAILGCVTDEATASSAELQPHRFRKWIHAQQVCEPGIGEISEQIVAEFPDFLRRNVEEKLESAVQFFYFLHELFRADLFHIASHHRAQSARALGGALKKLERLAGRSFERYISMTTTERLMAVMSIGEPVYVRRWEGLEVPSPKPLFAGHRSKPIVHDHFRAALFAAGVEFPGEEWETLEPGQVSWIDEGWALHSEPLDALAASAEEE